MTSPLSVSPLEEGIASLVGFPPPAQAHCYSGMPSSNTRGFYSTCKCPSASQSSSEERSHHAELPGRVLLLQDALLRFPAGLVILKLTPFFL